MRQITVDFSSPTSPLFAGYIGEHNATELIAIKPEDLSGAVFSLAFMTNGKVIHSKFFSADEEIRILLWKQLTQENTLYVQLEGYDENGDHLCKSPKAKLLLSNSVHGTDVVADTDNPNVYAEIAQNSLFREALENNVATLDKLTTSEDGKLLFDGNEINAGETKPITSADVFYENDALADRTNTVKGALDEAIAFCTEEIFNIFLGKNELEEAVNNALKKAKESGAFDGKDGNDYVLTEADKAEIAEIVKPKLKMLEVVVDDIEATIHIQNPLAITIEANLPLNARVTRVEIPDIVNGTDEFIALEDMISKDPSYGFDAPYFVMYPKGRAGQYSSFVAAAVVFPAYTFNSYYEQASLFSEKTIKIYYEIEE